MSPRSVEHDQIQAPQLEAGKMGAVTHNDHIDDVKPTISDGTAARSDEANLTIREAFRCYPKAVFFVLGVCLAIIMEGYDTGLLGSFYGLEQFRRAYGRRLANGDYQVDAHWQSACGAISSVGGVIGLAFTGWLVDRVGYRYSMFLGLLIMSGAIFIVFFAQSIVMIFAGGFVCGIPWGMFQGMASAYAADLSPMPLRPILTSYINLCWGMGQFLSTGVLSALLTRNDQWAYRIPFAVQWVWVIPIGVVVAFAPESPWWLVRMGRQDEALRVLRRIASARVSDDQVYSALREIVLTNEVEKQEVGGTSYVDLFRGTNLRRTEVSVFTWVCQVTCGIWFSTNIIYFMEQAGLSASVAFNFGLGVNAVSCASTIASWFIIPYVGRRTMYVWGLAVMFVTEVIVGFMYIDPPNSIGWAAGAVLIINVLAFYLTIGPVCYTIVPEAPTTRLRIKTVSLARASYNSFAVMAGFLNPQILNPGAWDLKGKGGFVWGSFCLLSLTWAYFRLPEMKGRTQAELEVLFRNKTKTKDFSKAVIEPNQLHIETEDKFPIGAHVETASEKV